METLRKFPVGVAGAAADPRRLAKAPASEGPGSLPQSGIAGSSGAGRAPMEELRKRICDRTGYSLWSGMRSEGAIRSKRAADVSAARDFKSTLPEPGHPAGARSKPPRNRGNSRPANRGWRAAAAGVP